MSLFAISDLHLSFGTDKPMDIFEGWEGYTQKLADQWNKTVREEDTVVIPGDVSWATKLDEFKQDAAFLHSLPGKKLIVKGNHDYWWTTAKKMKDFFSENGLNSISIVHNNAVPVGSVAVCGTRGWFYDLAENEDRKILLREAGRLETSLCKAEETGLEPVVFLHFPPVYGNYVCEELLDILIRHGIKRCYYGHIHGKSSGKAINGVCKGILFHLVSCDYLRFLPQIVEKE